MHELKLPQCGMGMTEGTVIRWLKQEGERVAEGEILLEVEAAKAVVEVEASVGGILSKVVAAEGDTVPVYAVLGLIE